MDTQFDRFRYPDDGPPVFVSCAECGGEICVGDEIRRTFDGEYVHDGNNDDCALNYAYVRQYDAKGTIDKRGGII